MAGDSLWSNVVFLLIAQGANGSTTFTDQSSYARTITPAGSVHNDTTVNVNGTPSVAFGADGNYLQCAYGTELDIGLSSPDFCMEVYANFTTVAGVVNQIFGRRRNSNNYIFAVNSGQLLFQTFAGTTATNRLAVGSVSANTVHHLCVIRSGSTYYGFVDGVLAGSATSASGTIGSDTTALYIGDSENNQPARYWYGNGNYMRITMGATRYNLAGFTPDTVFGIGPAGIVTGTLTESVGITPAWAAQAKLGVSASESVTLTSFFGEPKFGDITDLMTFDDVLADPVWGRVVTSGVVLQVSALDAVRRLAAVMTESVTTSDAAAALAAVVLRETLNASASPLPSAIYSVAASQTMRLQDYLRVGSPVTVSDSLLLDGAVLAQTVISVAEALQLSPTFLGQAVYGKSVSETLRASAILARFLSGEAIESIDVSEAPLALLRASASLSDSIVAEDNTTPLWVLRATVDEAVELTADDALQMLFASTIDETVDLSGGIFHPNGSFTTWAMNARTGAVTEYANYAFNSFAKMEDRYLGASENGLYELLGDDDEGTSIAARVKGGFMQFGGTKLSRLKEAYIAARGEGDFILRIITGDGLTYDYATSTRNMRSTKVHMGKGQRARYFAFELISTDGHDFDLDTLEFVPIVVTRRV